jgi:hypothetical protein
MSNHSASVPESSMLTGRTMRWVYRTVPTLSSLAVAAASFALSFVALRDVATSTQAVPASMAWLVPIVIDGGVLCASAVIWAAAAQNLKRPVFPFLVVFILVVLSVIVNAAHAGPSLLAKTIAALPPLVLLATLELVAIATRSSMPQQQPVEVASVADGAGIAVVHDVDVPAVQSVVPTQASSQKVSRPQHKPQPTKAARPAARTQTATAPVAQQDSSQSPASPTAVLDPVLSAADLKDLDDLDRWAASAVSVNEVVAGAGRRPRVRALDPEEG